MSKLLLWFALVSLTGSPLAALLILVVIALVLDRFTMRVLPDPVQGWARWSRTRALGAAIAHNPHDRRARLELADLLVQQRRFTRATEVIRVNVEAGDSDAETLFVAGRAFAGARQHVQAERLFRAVLEESPGFRMGAADLELGRLELARGQPQAAVPYLQRAAAARPSSIETGYLLAQALVLAGDQEKARQVRREAIAEYARMPRFQHRRERPWAWRLEPWRPAVFGVAFAATIFVIGKALGPRGAPRAAPAIEAERGR
jgi:uncharacterized protein (TIGR02996 family)